MEIIFLQVSEPTHKTNFLQHIHELVHVKLDKNDSYNTLFSKLREQLKDDPTKLNAANDWITYNEETDNDFSQKIITSDNDNLYAVFNLIP